MNLTGEKIRYPLREVYSWNFPSQIASKIISPYLDEICDTCDSIKDEEIKKLRVENRKLERLVEFLRNEVKSLELKTALSEKAMPLREMVKEFTSTPEGKKAFEKAWEDRYKEWEGLVKQGKMSRIKYYRLLSGIDQKTLAEKLVTAQPNISRIERPGYNIPVKTLKKLAKIFGVKMEDLIGD